MPITMIAPVSNMDRAARQPNADRDAARRRDAADRERSESGDAGLVTTLTLEDFRRLGVRPDEARLTVIRQAAVRTSNPLARRQLKMPSEKTELQLSQVATSAYRLLDPRNRVDATARIHVGRILPNALRWAAQASFSSGQADVEREDPVQLDSGDLSERESLIDQQIALLPQTGSELNVPWSRSLDSSDLLHSRPLASDWLRRQLHRPTVVVALMLLLSSTSLWLWNWRQKSIDSMARAMDYAATLQRPRHVDQSTDAANMAAQAPAASTPLRELADDDAEAGPVEQAHAAISTNAAAAVSEKLPSVEQEFAEDMASDEEFIDEFPVDLWNPLAEEIQLVEVDDSMLPLKTLWPLEPAIEWDEPNVSADLPEGLTAETEMIVIAPLLVETKPAIPGQESVASVRRQLTKRIAELRQPVSAENAGLLQSRLEEILTTVEGESVDAWTIQVMMAEIDWLSGDQLRVERRLRPLEQKFGADLDQLLAATFAGIPEFVDSAPLHASLLQSGFRLADRMLIHESLEHCRGITKSMTKSANFLGDAEQFRYMEEFDEAVTSMERLRRPLHKPLRRVSVMRRPVPRASRDDTTVSCCDAGNRACRGWPQGAIGVWHSCAGTNLHCPRMQRLTRV